LGKDLVDTDYVLSIFESIAVSDTVYFSNPPIVKIEQIQFFNSDTLLEEAASYSLSDESLVFDSVPEVFTRLEVTYKRGYEDKEDVPVAVKQAALLVLTDLYLNRGTFVLGKSVVHLQKTVDRLLQPYRKIKFV
jgi:hypothetical protein